MIDHRSQVGSEECLEQRELEEEAGIQAEGKEPDGAPQEDQSGVWVHPKGSGVLRAGLSLEDGEGKAHRGGHWVG